MAFKAPRGTRDILPDEASRWEFLENSFRERCRLYGFQEIRTPIFEHTELFVRSVGESSDIVSKEMYTFHDRSGRSLTLRPEGTAPVVRAYLENGLHEKPHPVKLYYFGPMFRYDRPQAGRYRQFHQFGLELFGSPQPSADVEIMALSYDMLRSLPLPEFRLELNSVGCRECRPGYRERLREYLRFREEELCPDCSRRYRENPLRVLDCKKPECKDLSAGAPLLTQSLCPQCAGHLARVRELLERLELPYVLNPRLVRGLDYYTRTAFEFVAPELGAQASLGGGGRYDALVEECGGPPTPGVGVAFGLERIILLADWKERLEAGPVPVFLAVAGEGLEEEALLLAREIRALGVPAEVELGGRSLKSQMKYAGKKGFARVIIIGSRELEQDRFLWRDMVDGSQVLVSREELRQRLLEQEG
ncbi:MAG TPA: histidine--tRNA ligase [Bacillota bacterium]|nr:histidine--tRNA ligase [Bacillota bacterium]